MTDKQIIIDGVDVYNCKYYMKNNGVEHQGLYQYANMCYKLPYDNCENKRFCWHKIISKIKEHLANIKLLKVYRYGLLSLFKIIVLVLLELILFIVLVTTIPLWWLKHIQKLLSNFGDVIKEAMDL